eukprot:654890-Pelagomonas_calceolata.AAC.1
MSALFMYDLHARVLQIEKRRKTQAVRMLPTSTKGKRIPKAETLRTLFTKRNKRKKSTRIKRVTSSIPCLTLVMRVERSLFKSASGAS